MDELNRHNFCGEEGKYKHSKTGRYEKSIMVDGMRGDDDGMRCNDGVLRCSET